MSETFLSRKHSFSFDNCQISVEGDDIVIKINRKKMLGVSDRNNTILSLLNFERIWDETNVYSIKLVALKIPRALPPKKEI